jgi:hypothetical protein
MGLIDLSFRAVGAETLREYWPVFVVGAVAQVWLVRRIRRWGRFPLEWVVFAAVAPTVVLAVFWGESFVAGRAIAATIGETGVSEWEQLAWHFARSRPLLAPLAVVLLALSLWPRSETVVAGLVTAAGVLVSWVVAMWLYTSPHSPEVVGVLVRAGSLGVVAALTGFTVATALWMAIGRWIWKQGRRRSGHADAPRARISGRDR